MDRSLLSRRSLGLAGAGAGVAAVAAAAPTGAKKRRKVVVPAMVHASAPVILLEDATPDATSRSGARYRIVIGEGVHAVQTTEQQEVLPASGSSLLPGALGSGQQVFQITGGVAPAPTGEDRGFAYAGRFAGTFSVLSGEQDPETGVLTFEVDVIDFLTKVYPGPTGEADPRMIGNVRLVDAVIVGFAY